eukprot:14477229-Alexandrium_andersonii.AAC.1
MPLSRVLPSLRPSSADWRGPWRGGRCRALRAPAAATRAIVLAAATGATIAGVRSTPTALPPLP